MSVETDIEQLKIDVAYNRSMLADMVLTMKPGQGNNDALTGMMENFKNMINADPHLNDRPDIKNTINNMFKVKP